MIPVVAAMILDGSRVLVTQRPHDAKIGAGHWEFPGGKIEFGESPETSLRREIQEELCLEIDVDELVCVTSHLSGKTVTPLLADAVSKISMTSTFELPAHSQSEIAKQTQIVLLSYLCRIKSRPQLHDPEFRDLNSYASQSSSAELAAHSSVQSNVLERDKIEAADYRWLSIEDLRNLLTGLQVRGLSIHDFAVGDRLPLEKLLTHLRARVTVES